MQNSVISLSPSFNSYSDGKMTEIAARVGEEFDSVEFYDEFCFETQKNCSAADADSDGEFEFRPFPKADIFQLADEIFQNGQIRPVYPVFNRDLLLGQHDEIENGNIVHNSDSSSKGTKIRLPLRKLFLEERETDLTTSSSSSETVDELDGVPEEMYCVWMPAEGRCKKSSSAGSNSKRWKFKDLLLNKSHSDGSKGSFVF